MKLPNGAIAVVDVRKLRDYFLSQAHPRGRHKAKVFSAALGMTVEHAEDLRKVLLAAAREAQAVELEKDVYGRRFMVECPISGPGGQGALRSLWIIRAGEDFPRLLTCYVA